MKKYVQIITLAAIALLAVCMIGCAEVPVETGADGENEELTVVASFYPLAYLTQEVAGDTIDVVNLIPSGGEPHHYEPTVKQMAMLENADLFVFQGAGMESWVESQEESLEAKGVKLLEASSHLDLLKTEDGHHEEEHHDEHEHEHEDDHEDEHREDEHHHDHGEFDPHTWLDPVLAIETVKLIEHELAELDPANTDTFSANADALIAELSQLNDEFKSTLGDCEINAFITSHDAFQYLAHRYNLEVVAVAGISPHDEPSAVQIAELIEHAAEENIEHIFFEVLANSETAETLAAEAGLTPLVLDPIGGLSKDTADGTFVSLMKSNLENLKTGLRCQSAQ